jgi:hypothetical protein
MRYKLVSSSSRFTKGDSAVNQLINITNDRFNSQTKTIRNFRQYTQVVSKLSLWAMRYKLVSSSNSLISALIFVYDIIYKNPK